MNTLHLILLTAATWRLASLVANEEGPYMIFHRFRKWASRSKNRWVRRSRFATLLHCEWCNSVWFGALLGWPYLFLNGEPINPVIALTLPLVLSTGTIVIKTIVQTLGGIDKYYDKLNNAPSHLVNGKADPLSDPRTLVVQWSEKIQEERRV